MKFDRDLKENIDYYYNEQGYRVFTEAYHLKRGYCCKSGCKHCPYGYDKKTDTISFDNTKYRRQTPDDAKKLEEIRKNVDDKGILPYLRLIEEPEETGEDGKSVLKGLTYSDILLMLKWYKVLPR